MSVHHIAPGCRSVNAYLTIENAAAALNYYEKAFGAEILMQLCAPDGTVMHAEFKIGDTLVMVGERDIESNSPGPKDLGGTPVSLMIYVENCDAVFERALAEGGTVCSPLENQFYGDRSGMIIDPFGHKWCVATHVEDVSEDEVNRRMAAMFES